MAVYVDDMYLTPMGRHGRLKMSHMIADSHSELMRMVETIGIDPKWIQAKGTPREHFDVCQTKRAAAINAGAIPITMRELSERTRAKRLAVSDPHYAKGRNL